VVASPEFRSYTAETFGPVPGSTSGSASVLGVKLDAKDWDRGRLTFVSYIGANMLPFEYPNVTAEYLRVLARSYSDDNAVSEFTFTNYLASIENILFSPIITTATLGQVLKQFYDGTSLHQIVGFTDPSDTLANLAYLPSFPTSNMMDFIRNVAQALGKPIVDMLSHVVILDDYLVINKPKIVEFAVSGERPSPQQESVSINWYKTALTVGNGAGDGIRCLMYQSDQSISIESGDTQEFTVQMQGTPTFLETDLTPLSAIPFSGGKYNMSQGSCYCVTGADGYIVSPGRWLNTGGRITVRRGTGPFDLIVTIKAPDVEDDPLSPYTITEGADRPALYVTSVGGVTYQPQNVFVPLTPAADAVPGLNGITLASTEADAIDMPFVDTEERAWGAALRYSATVSSVVLTCSGTFAIQRVASPVAGEPSYEVVGDKSVVLLPGCKFYRNGVFWRITSIDVDYDNGTVSFDGENGTTFQDFNDNFSDMVYNVDTGTAEWTDRFVPLTFDEFDEICTARGVESFTQFDVMPIVIRPGGNI